MGIRVSPAPQAEGTAGLSTAGWSLSILTPTLVLLPGDHSGRGWGPEAVSTTVLPLGESLLPGPTARPALAVSDTRLGVWGKHFPASVSIPVSTPHPTPHSPGDALGAWASRAFWSRGGARSPQSLLRKVDAFPK